MYKWRPFADAVSPAARVHGGCGHLLQQGAGHLEPLGQQGEGHQAYAQGHHAWEGD